MAFMDSMNRMRDKSVIRQAYRGAEARNQALSDQAHTQALRRIGRQAAEDGLTIDEAYQLYDDYLATLEGTDSAWDDEAAQEGEDPANYEEEDEL